MTSDNINSVEFFANEKILHMRCTAADGRRPETGRLIKVSGLGDAIDGWYDIEATGPDGTGWRLQLRKVTSREAAKRIYRREVARLRYRVKDKRALEFLDALDTLTLLTRKKDGTT